MFCLGKHVVVASAHTCGQKPSNEDIHINKLYIHLLRITPAISF